MKILFFLSVFISTFVHSLPGDAISEEQQKSLIQKRQNKAVANRRDNVGAAAQFDNEKRNIQEQQESQGIPSLRFQADDRKPTSD
jgi:hypothetical protein